MLWLAADMTNSIETAIAIAIFGTIAIGIAIAKAIFQLLLLLGEFSNYCYCYWYCQDNPKTIAHNLIFNLAVTASESELELC